MCRPCTFQDRTRRTRRVSCVWTRSGRRASAAGTHRTFGTGSGLAGMGDTRDTAKCAGRSGPCTCHVHRADMCHCCCACRRCLRAAAARHNRPKTRQRRSQCSLRTVWPSARQALARTLACLCIYPPDTACTGVCWDPRAGNRLSPAGLQGTWRVGRRSLRGIGGDTACMASTRCRPSPCKSPWGNRRSSRANGEACQSLLLRARLRRCTGVSRPVNTKTAGLKRY